MKACKMNSAVRAIYGAGKAARVIAVLKLEDGVDHDDFSVTPLEDTSFSLKDAARYHGADVLKMYHGARRDAAPENVLAVRCIDGAVRLRKDGNGQPVPRTYNEAGYVNTFIIPALVEATMHDCSGTPLPYDDARFRGHVIRWQYVPGLKAEGGNTPDKPRKKARTTKRRGGKKA